MKLICEACGHVYSLSERELGEEDPVCSEPEPGKLRELTNPERIWLMRYADLYEDFKKQAHEIRRLTTPQGTLL